MFRHLLSSTLWLATRRWLHPATSKPLTHAPDFASRKSTEIEPLESRIAPATLYVGHSSDYTLVLDQGAPGLDANDTVTWNAGTGSHLTTPVAGLTYGTDAFGTIGAAVAAAHAGDTIEIATGLFVENVTINTSLTLLGANAGIAGSDSAHRTAETILQTNGNQNAVITLNTGNVTIDGLTLEGNDPGVTGGALGSGVDSNSVYGVRPSGAYSHLTVQNNIVKDVAIGFRGDGAASNNLITQNWFDSVGNYDFGYAVSLRTNFYAEVTNNLMTRVWTGVHLNNFYQAGPAAWNVSGNTIQSYAAGIWVNLDYSAAAPLTLDHDQISAATGAVANNIGLLFASVQDAEQVNVTNTTVTGTDYGVVAINASTSHTLTLNSTDAVTATHVVGLYHTDVLSFNPIGTTVFPVGAASTFAVDGASISATSGIGIKVDATGGTATTLTVSGAASISGGATGLQVAGSLAGIAGNTLGALSFSGQSGQYILLSSAALAGAELDATGVSFDGHMGATATLAQNLAIEDKITHYMDNTTLGLVRVKAGNLFVSASSGGSIQRAIDRSSPGDTVNVNTGVYAESVNVNQALALDLGGSIAVNSLAGIAGSAIHLNAFTLTEGDATSTTYAGLIDGAGGGLVKQGAGEFVLSGANSYTGVTSIQAGTLTATNDSALGASGVSANTIVASGATLNLEGNITLAESLALSGAGVGGAAGALENSSGDNAITGPITFTGATTINVAAGTTLTASGGGDGAVDVTVANGAGGEADLAGGYGSHAALLSFVTSGAGGLHLSGAVKTSGTITFGTAVTLTGDVALTSVNHATTFNSTVNGGYALTIDAVSGIVDFNSTVGGVTPLGAVVINTALNVDLSSTFNAASLVLSDVLGTTTVGGALTLTNPAASFSATTGTLEILGAVSAAGNISWTTDNIDIAANVHGAGALFLEPLTLSRSIGVGALVVGLNLDSGEIGFLQPGFTLIKIGAAGDSGVVTVGAVGFNDPLEVFSTSGSIQVTGAIAADGGATFEAPALSFNVGSGIAVATHSHPIVINAAVTLLANTELATNAAGTGADISIDGTINGHFDLNLQAGTTGAINLNSSHLKVNASVGGSAPLTSLELYGEVLNLQPLILTTGSQFYHAEDAINFNAGGMSSSAGSITFDGDLNIFHPMRVTTSGAAVTFNGTVDNVTGGSGALSISDPGAGGDVTFAQAVGHGTRLISLSVVKASTVTFQHDLAVVEGLSLTANQVNFDGAPGELVQGGGPLTLQPYSLTTPIEVGAPSNVFGVFTVTTADLAALHDGFSSITIGNITDTGGLSIDSGGASFSDPVTFNQGKKGSVTVSGTLTGTGNAAFNFAMAQVGLGADIITQNGSILFVGARLFTDVDLTAGGGGNIGFTGKIIDTASGGHDLNLAAGGNISLTGGAGAGLGSFTSTAGGLTTIFKGIVATDITVMGSALNLGGNYTVTGTNGIVFDGDVTLLGNVSIANKTSLTHFEGSIDSTPLKTYNLSIKQGSADLTVDASIGYPNPLGTISISALGHTTLGGSIHAQTLKISAHDFAVADVTTWKGQTYSGNATFSGALSGTTLSLTTKASAPITDSSDWIFSGAAQIKAASAALTLSGALNHFGSLTLSAAAATITDSSDATLGAITVTGAFSLTAGGDVIQTAALKAGSLAIAADSGAITLANANNVISTLDGISALGNITVLSGGTKLTLADATTSSTGSITIASDMRTSKSIIVYGHGINASNAFSPGSSGFVTLYSYTKTSLTDLGLTFPAGNLVGGHRYPFVPASPVAGDIGVYVKP